MNIIAAVSPEIDGKLWIGKDNELLYHDEFDMEVFKKYTLSSVVVMGRSTYESIGNPLKNRLNIVLTTNEELLHQTEYMKYGRFNEEYMNKIVKYVNDMRASDILPDFIPSKSREVMFVSPDDLFKVLLYLHSKSIIIFETYLIGGTKTFEAFINRPVIGTIILDEFVTKPEKTPNKEFPLTEKQLSNLIEVEPVGLCGKFLTRHYEFEERLGVIESYLTSCKYGKWTKDLVNAAKKCLVEKDYENAYSILISVIALMRNYDSNILRTFGKCLNVNEEDMEKTLRNTTTTPFQFASTIYEELRDDISDHFSNFVI